MFQEFEGLLQRVASGEVDLQSIGQAAGQHVNPMDSSELSQHVQTAASNAQQNGDIGIATQLVSLLEQYRSNPDGLKGEVVDLIKNNPQILQHFAPDFAKNILGAL